jgi:hypothetical protein
MRKISTIVVATAALLCGWASPAAAERPWTGYLVVDQESRPSVNNIGPGSIIYLNRNGGTFKPGYDDSRTNTSSVAYTTSTLSAFNCSDAVWQQVLACVKDQFAPYNVTVTDVDPGNTPHVESVVAGNPQQMKTQQYPQGLPCGQGGCVGGIAPLGCNLYLDNPITYSFANIYQCNAQAICETVAQETAHAFGMDHENYCPDPMTYKTGCGAKKFQDYDAPCGEYSNRKCQCTNASTQNSHQTLLQIFGPKQPGGTDSLPQCEITKPSNGAVVAPGFAIEANASDDKGLARVELWIDGQMVGQKTSAPFAFAAPGSLGDGQHTILVRAVDTANQQTDDQASVTVQSNMQPGGCTSNDECPSGYVCDAGGDCVPGPSMEGGLGSPCTDGAMCESGLCASGPDGMRCVILCVPGGNDCPDGYTCLPAGDQGACWPGEDVTNPGNDTDDVKGGCGCRAGGEGAGAGALGGLALLGLSLAGVTVTRRRGRRRGA